MAAASLDIPLDELISSRPAGKGKGKGKAKAAKNNSDWKGNSKDFVDAAKNNSDWKGNSKDSVDDEGSAETKLDMALDDVIKNEFTPKQTEAKTSSWSNKAKEDSNSAWKKEKSWGDQSKDDAWGASKGWGASKEKVTNAQSGWSAKREDRWGSRAGHSEKPASDARGNWGNTWSDKAERPARQWDQWEGRAARTTHDDWTDRRTREVGSRPGGGTVGYGYEALKRKRDEEAGPSHKTTRGVSKTIKVTNVPSDLRPCDIKQAFEAEAGRTLSCELERGTAFLTFARADDARRAVEAFDRGELNGHTITVGLCD